MLVIPTADLPCGQIANYPFNYVNVNKVTIHDLIDYISNYPKDGNDITKFIYRYNFWRHFLIADEIKFNSLYLPDLYYIEYVSYINYVTDEFNFNFSYACNNCNSNNKVVLEHNDISYEKLDYLGYRYHFSNGLALEITYPNGKDIDKYLHIYASRPYRDFLTLGTILSLIATTDRNSIRLADLESIIFGATHADAVNMMEMMRSIRPPIKNYRHSCKNCRSINIIDMSSITEIDLYYSTSDLDTLLKYKIFMNKNDVFNLEKYSFKQVLFMYKILSDEDKQQDKIRIRLNEKGISYKT